MRKLKHQKAWKLACSFIHSPGKENSLSNEKGLAATGLRRRSRCATGRRTGISHLGIPRGEVADNRLSSKSSIATISHGVTAHNAHRHREWEHALWPFPRSLDSHHVGKKEDDGEEECRSSVNCGVDDLKQYHGSNCSPQLLVHSSADLQWWGLGNGEGNRDIPTGHSLDY